jgi:hypothetical protein
MQIQTQSLNYLNAYNAISTSSTKIDAATTTSSTANTTSSADVVSISSEAQQLLQSSQTSSSSASGSKYVLSADSPYKRLSELFHEDPSDAAKMHTNLPQIPQMKLNMILTVYLIPLLDTGHQKRL